MSNFCQCLELGNAQERACAIAFKYAHGDGSQHKQWIIDQMVRTLAGSGYQTFCHEFLTAHDTEWSKGIAP